MPITEDNSWLQGENPSLISRLLNAGVDDETSLEQHISCRYMNMATLTTFLVAMFSAPVGYAVTKSPVFALTSCALAIAYLAIYLATSVGLHRIARLSLSVLANVHFLAVCNLLGPLTGIEYYLILIIIFAIIIFARQAIFEQVIVVSLILITCILLAYIFNNIEPILTVSEIGRKLGFYQSIAVLVLTCGYIFYVLHFSSVENFARLKEANHRSTKLLDQLLPELISKRVQDGMKIDAQSHAEATVMFADIIGFDALSGRLGPRHLVEILNEVFTEFDRLASLHGIEKIKTIGSGYMAATGVSSSADHPDVHNMLRMAIDALMSIADISRQHGLDIDVRFGISTGNVVSGVVGEQKQTFDLWGDTVNLASRLETSAARGEIRVSESAYWRLKDTWRFHCMNDVELKGIGKINVYVYQPDPVDA